MLPGLQCEDSTTCVSYFTIHHVEYVIQSSDQKKSSYLFHERKKEPLKLLECIEKFKKFNQGQNLAKPIPWCHVWCYEFSLGPLGFRSKLKATRSQSWGSFFIRIAYFFTHPFTRRHVIIYVLYLSNIFVVQTFSAVNSVSKLTEEKCIFIKATA